MRLPVIHWSLVEIEKYSNKTIDAIKCCQISSYKRLQIIIRQY